MSRRLERRPGRYPPGDRSLRVALTRIRAVFFDAGATLLHPSPPVEEVYARELALDGAPFTPEELSRALTRVWEEVQAEAAGDRYGGVRGEPRFWQGFLNRVRGHLDGREVSAAAFERLRRHFRDAASWEVYSDVVETLDRLEAAGIRLAVVSNWDSHLPELLGALGLASRFEQIAVSAIEEVGKPDPEIFRRVCIRVGVAPESALHVGDSVREDLEGARGAGLRALLLDRTDRHPEIPDRVRSLAEIPTLLV